MERICGMFLNEAPCCLVDNMTEQLRLLFELNCAPPFTAFAR